MHSILLVKYHQYSPCFFIWWRAGTYEGKVCIWKRRAW